jgi:phosphoribosylaminoimidazolecarboxamide formyltransferase/IMP cyclohydrolase
MENISQKSALISVYNKNGIEKVAKKLKDLNIRIISTGGTEKYLSEMGFEIEKVESLTEYPSIFGGRVKTLHPKVFGGILFRRENTNDSNEKFEYDIPSIDYVIVDLYPFENTVNDAKSHEEIIEKIDIGGISLIRAAAKNFNHVVCLSSVDHYDEFLDELDKNKGIFSIEKKKKYAAKAFKISSSYDNFINQYFEKGSIEKSNELRYGENPHQKGSFVGEIDSIFEKLNGKELSYNNLLDIDSAYNLIKEFWNNDSTFAILKHNNACGLATRNSILEAYKKALLGDPISAFGGVLISNKEIDLHSANEINKLFFEVIMAPSYSIDALKILSCKKNRIILKIKNIELDNKTVRTCLNGVLTQDRDNITDNLDHLEYVTKKLPTNKEVEDLLFASKISKHTKSNTIVLAKNNQLISSGTGQTSRVDALNQAIDKAKKFNFDLKNSVMASDAFFPFPDCVEIASNNGICSVIQPGGSIKDNLSIDYCNNNNISMVFTRNRHFKH